MAGYLITSLLSLITNLLPSITASAQAPSSSSSNSNNSERGRARAVEENLERLKVILKGIKATLLDADEREIRDHYVKHWLKELKKVAYDAEDVLSEYQYEVTRVQVEAIKASEASRSHQRKQMESIQHVVPVSDDMVDRLIKIRSRFDEIANDREALQLRESDGVRRPNNNILRPPTSHMVDEASIFGRDTEIKEVIDFLLSEKENSFSVISIVGKGGLGKTTIAQLVYKHGRVSECFDLFGWVYVSEEFDVRRLIKATIESISSKIFGVSELSPLQKELAKTVKGKTILLVLDDVWNDNLFLWELFRVPFNEAKMVRILMTTRNQRVAEVVQTTNTVRPTNLPEDSCWQLFQHYAFSGTSDIMQTDYLVDMGRAIMRKCGGLPLVVKSIASLLRHEKYECWREILESDLWESHPLHDIFPALLISYAHLPPYLKPCFLFCSMYPKEDKIEMRNLIELWISHGYIESRGNKRKTEIGVEYYEELKKRSLLDDFSSGQHYQCCKLHDVIHDLARLISENEHYSVVSDLPLYINKVKVPQEVCHLYARVLDGSANQILQQNLKGLRTLSIDPGNFEENDEGNLTKCEALRVLQLHWCSTQIPHSISKLKHLTYLYISSHYLKTLPLAIGILYNLQTLILECYALEYLPETIGDLANLQYLNIESGKFKMLPKSLCSLSNMQRLVISCNHLEEVPLDLKNLHNLYELTIFSQDNLALPYTIGCLSNLEKLQFSFVGDLGNVPHGLVSFPAIRKMTAGLRIRNIAWLKDMNAFEGRLSIEGLEKSNLVDAERANLKNKCKLEALNLCWNHDSNCNFLPVWKHDLRLRLIPEACEDRGVTADDVDFSLLECLQPHPSLKNLSLKMYPSAKVPRWMRDPLSLQSIQEIRLEYCYYIHSLPFHNLHTLKQLIIHACYSFQVLQLEQLPSQLEELQIHHCNRLESITGLGDLDLLASLRIQYCRALKSLTIHRLQLVEPTEILGDSSHEKPHIGRQNISSLTSLVIKYCALLSVLPDGLIPSGPCDVCIQQCGCPDLEITDQQ